MLEDERFLKVLQFLADGYKYFDIADVLGTTEQVIRNSVAKYLQATGTDNSRHLVAWAFRNNKVT
jgi:DNA-binding NarL/FixJ family response regulator